MSLIDILLCIFLPPVAVIDKGAKAIVITAVLWILGGIPGIIAAFYYKSH